MTAENDDFTPVSRTVEFAVGISEVSVDVVIESDNELEGDEGFVLELSNPVGGSIHPYEGETTIFILDDDGKSGVFVLSNSTTVTSSILFCNCLCKFDHVVGEINGVETQSSFKSCVNRHPSNGESIPL